MTRGRCGSLLLHRTTLAFATPRRFIPAHRSGATLGSLARTFLGHVGVTYFLPARRIDPYAVFRKLLGLDHCPGAARVILALWTILSQVAAQ